jgi:hypothetical protein
MENSYNRRHHAVEPFVVGTYALLSRSGLNWAPDSEVSKRLLAPYIGPFEIIDVDTARANVTLRLPLSMRCHPTFHQSHIRRYTSPDKDFPGRHVLKNDLPPDISEDGFELFEVDQVLGSRFRGRGHNQIRQYLVRWKGADRSHDSWEPEEFMASCPDALQEFLNRDHVFCRLNMLVS